MLRVRTNIPHGFDFTRLCFLLSVLLSSQLSSASKLIGRAGIIQNSPHFLLIPLSTENTSHFSLCFFHFGLQQPVQRQSHNPFEILDKSLICMLLCLIKKNIPKHLWNFVLEGLNNKFLNGVSCNQMKIICKSLLVKLSKTGPDNYGPSASPTMWFGAEFFFFCIFIFHSF